MGSYVKWNEDNEWLLLFRVADLALNQAAKPYTNMIQYLDP